MNENVAAIAGLNCGLRGICVSRDNDRAIWRNEPIPIAFHRVLRWKSRYGHIGILVDKSGADLVHVNIMSVRAVTLISVSVRASFDVDTICLLEMLGHGFQVVEHEVLCLTTRRTTMPFLNTNSF